jgi:putative transposase
MEGVLWILRTGARWKDLPKEYPSPATCWRRLGEWDRRDVWLDLWRASIAQLDERQQIDWSEAFMDGTFAPAKKGALRRKDTQGYLRRRPRLMTDHVHMMISIPPMYSVAQVVGYIKGKSAIHVARLHGERKRNFVGQHFWARGYFVSTVGRDEATFRHYIRKQEEEDKCVDQLILL